MADMAQMHYPYRVFLSKSFFNVGLGIDTDNVEHAQSILTDSNLGQPVTCGVYHGLV